MKMYMLRNSEGLYLNSSYRASRSHGNWRDRDNARLYRSKQGIRAALYGTAFPAMKKHIGMENYTRPEGRWTDEDRAASRALFDGIMSIKPDVWWELLAKDGYILEEVDI